MNHPATRTAEASEVEHSAGGNLMLPGGVLGADGRRCRRVRIRELRGVDEERLCDRRYETNAARVTAFLAHVVVEIEGVDRPTDEALISNMLVGDRDFLMLRVRQLSLGDEVHQVMRCPAPACGEKVDVEFMISELGVRQLPELRASYEVVLPRPLDATITGSERVHIRLPTGRDQEAVADLWQENRAWAETVLLSRLIELPSGQRLGDEQVRELPTALRRPLLEFVREMSPGPDLAIEIRCPYCSADMSYEFDLHRFFFEEFMATSRHLLQEVHLLAFNYHWAERDILELSRTRRRRYLECIAAAGGAGS